MGVVGTGSFFYSRFMLMKLTEEMINELICHSLYHRGGFITRIAPSGFFTKGRMIKHKSKFIKRGIPDILYWHKGESYAFEVKTPTAYKYIVKHYNRLKITPKIKLNKTQIHIKEQIEVLEALKKEGVHAHFVCSVDQVKELLN